MGCNSSKNVNVIVPTRSSVTSMTTNTKAELTPEKKSIPTNVSPRTTPRPSFSEYLSPTNRSQALDTSVENESLNQSNSDQLSKPKEPRRISILDSIRQTIHEDYLKAKMARSYGKEPEAQKPSATVYQIKINGKLVAQTSTPRQDNLKIGERKNRERSMTETTDHSISKKAMTKSTTKSRRRKSSVDSINSIRSIVGQIKRGRNSLSDLEAKNLPIDSLRVPTPERVQINLHFERNSLPNLTARSYTDSDVNTPEKSDQSSFSSISQE